MSNKKIIVWGATFTNKGSMAMLETLQSMYEGSPLYFVCDHKDDERIFTNNITPISGLFGAKRYLIFILQLLCYKLSFGLVFKNDDTISALRGTDLFIDLSGFALTEDFSANSCTYRSAIFLMQATISKLFSGKYYIFPQAVGPMSRKLNKLLFQLILILADRVYVRGRRSFEFTQNFRFHNAKRVSDLVFINSTYSTLSLSSNEVTPFVLVNPNSRIVAKQTKLSSEKYVADLSEMITRLSEKYLIVLTPNELRQNEEDDLDICFSILRRLPSNVRTRVRVNEDVSLPALLRLCEDCEYAIVSRFHLMIFCLMKSTLPIVISWSDKYLDIMEEFDIPEYVLPESDFVSFEISDEKVIQARKKIQERFMIIQEDMKSELTC
jgi:polysaccharide pyruvyl transferase WcaK-like protein